MTDWAAALREMEREEPRLYRRLRGLDHRFTDELKAELERHAVEREEESLKPGRARRKTWKIKEPPKKR